ncbi:related to F-actin-capping protein subunit beta [Saccharomycodes ludwigii]|uniref:F-actin-capping protein subunit beta n=1 Tax=Saccharomycodes ludwigii TaxID=36035 RepID=A0A376B411_9ASCO|nr:related to F-actin-capping protein subunit beta [Saccharomycodes ludwigii]
MSDEQYDAALDLLSRLNPGSVQENLMALISLEPTLADDLLSSVDQPLKLLKPKLQQQNDNTTGVGKDFLCCDYNRDGDYYRSPWTNKYYNLGTGQQTQETEESYFPGDELRNREQLFNDSFEVYKDMYYENGGVSSCYLWETSEIEDNTYDNGFAGVVLFQKGKGQLGKWDSIHVFEVSKETEDAFNYKLTSTIILHLNDNDKTKLGGNLTRQVEKVIKRQPDNIALDEFHITNVGSMVEDIETQMRTMLEVVYFEKTMDIYHQLKFAVDTSDNRAKQQEDIIKGLQNL